MAIPTRSRRAHSSSPQASRPPATTPRFYDGRSISREPRVRTPRGVQPTEVGMFYELSYNLL
jgi:hypothetical protein